MNFALEMLAAFCIFVVLSIPASSGLLKFSIFLINLVFGQPRNVDSNTSFLNCMKICTLALVFQFVSGCVVNLWFKPDRFAAPEVIDTMQQAHFIGMLAMFVVSIVIFVMQLCTQVRVSVWRSIGITFVFGTFLMGICFMIGMFAAMTMMPMKG